MRKLVWICAVLAACGGSPSEPSAPSNPSNPANPEPRTPNPGSSAVLTDDLGGRQLLPPDNWWNQDISAAPIDPQSDAYINFVGRTRTAHPDFGPPPYGI